MRNLVFVLLLLIAPAAAALDDCSEVEALDALYGIRDLVIRGAGSYAITSAIEESLNGLRGPLPDGSYRWVNWVKPSGSPPIVKHGHTVSAVHGSGTDSVEASAGKPFAVAVVVPKKRSLFSGNNPSWVGEVEIQFTLDGRQRTRTESINAWLNPGTSRTFDLGTIADDARVRIEAATSAQYTEGEALVEIHFKQAVEQDDPDNPQYETIRSLQRIRSSSSPEVLDAEIAKLERRLFPSLQSYRFTFLIAKTREAEVLLKSDKPKDQEKGKKLLKEVVDEVKE
ncbi:MAG: hypothetical protein HYU52_02615 [Acidobacteria bacterium]|nr:hypothetical protein [Acidobacteriota bacterium]